MLNIEDRTENSHPPEASATHDFAAPIGVEFFRGNCPNPQIALRARTLPEQYLLLEK